jgi:DNA-binding NarL/FixJ family response regulator
MNVYILDDEPMIVEAIADQLMEHVGSITAETNSGLALEHLVRNIEKYDLIISDFHMGLLNGDDIYNSLLAAHKSLPPYIFFSSENSQTIRSSLNGNSKAEIIFKAEWDELINLVRNLKEK